MRRGLAPRTECYVPRVSALPLELKGARTSATIETRLGEPGATAAGCARHRYFEENVHRSIGTIVFARPQDRELRAAQRRERSPGDDLQEAESLPFFA